MNKKGAILVMVLLVMAVVVSGVMVIEEWASKDYSYSEQLYINNQSAFYFHSAVKVAEKLLGNDNNKYDSQKDNWFDLPPFRINSSTIVYMSIMPANAKIDINNIKVKNKNLLVRTQKAVDTLFKNASVDAPTYFKKLFAWMGYKYDYNDEEYTYGYHPIKGKFFSLKEIDFVNGLDMFSSKFHKCFTVNNVSGKININFASKKVIEAYLPEIADCAEDIIKYREKKPFENITQIRKVECITDKNYLKIQPYITTSSSVFVVKIDVDINGINKYATALLSRSSGGAKVLKYFEGKGFYE